MNFSAPARMMQVTTGVSSRDSASPSTPPTDRVRPSLANSLRGRGGGEGCRSEGRECVTTARPGLAKLLLGRGARGAGGRRKSMCDKRRGQLGKIVADAGRGLSGVRGPGRGAAVGKEVPVCAGGEGGWRHRFSGEGRPPLRLSSDPLPRPERTERRRPATQGPRKPFSHSSLLLYPHTLNQTPNPSLTGGN